MTSDLTGEVAVDPGAARAHLTLAWDEAQRGCTRVVEVDGRLEWLDIPPSAEDGQEICFPGRGKAVPDDNRHGDLRVTLEVLPEPVCGGGLSAELEVSPIEALTGGRKTVEVDGRTVWVRVPAHVSSGDTVVIPGEGAEGENGGPRGDLTVVLKVSTTLPIAVPEFEAPATDAGRSVVRYEQAPPPAPVTRKGPSLWLLAVLASAVIGAGATAVFLPHAGGPAQSTVIPSPPLPETRPAQPVIPVKPQADPTPAPHTASGPVQHTEPAQTAPRHVEPAHPAPRPRRTVRIPRPRRPVPVAVARPKPRPARSAPAAKARFCSRCGRPISSGRFCGNCGRKL
jgi:hypothetical protein